MKATIHIDEAFRNRKDLHELVAAAADYLASRDREPGLNTQAEWRVTGGPQGEPQISLTLREDEFTSSYTLTPRQLTPAGLRNFHILDAWDAVLKYRLDKQVQRTNEAIAQMEE